LITRAYGFAELFNAKICERSSHLAPKDEPDGRDTGADGRPRLRVRLPWGDDRCGSC
jgi:hypothetical protein